MKNVLVAVDGSDASKRAVEQAVVLARAFDARLTLLHVVAPISVPTDAPWVTLDTLLDAELERGHGLVRGLVGALGYANASELVKVGTAAEAIAEVAAALPAWLVVVGSTGKGAVKRLLLGSVADRVVHLCEAPVLVVR